MKPITLLLLLSIGTISANAKSIETPYLDLTVPDDFQCSAETGKYVCQPSSGPKMKDSILTMVFKRSGPSDTISEYKTYLGRPMSRVVPSGPPALSKVNFVRAIKIANTEWIESKHTESEIANYVTYYWATVRSPVAMVVTYSVEKSHESARMKELTVIRDSFRVREVNFSPPTETTIGQQIATPGSGAQGLNPLSQNANQVSEKLILGQKPVVLIAAAAIVLIALFFLIRR